jgi:hypothetical protein
MALCFNDVCPFVQQDMISLNDSSQPVEDGFLGQINLVKEDPLTILNALEQSTLDKLEDKTTTSLQLRCALLQVNNRLL